MKRRLASVIALVTLVVFSLYLVPHEIVHVFYDHHDTEHCDEHTATTTVSSIHIHCDFLNGDLTDFVAGEHQQPGECSADLPFHYATIDVQNIRCVAVLRDSRGPPVS